MRHLLNPQSNVHPTWITTNTRTHRPKVREVLERRGWNLNDNGPGDGVLRMLVCQVLNFSQNPYAVGIPDELWTPENIAGRSRDWLRSQHHSDAMHLPTEVDCLICHPTFLRAHGAPTQVRTLPNDVLDIDSANFDAEFGEGACFAVLRHLSRGGDENTRMLRLSWERNVERDSLLDALPAVAPRIGIPGLLVGGGLTWVENTLGVELLECLGCEIPVVGPLFMLVCAVSIFAGISSSTRN